MIDSFKTFITHFMVFTGTSIEIFPNFQKQYCDCFFKERGVTFKLNSDSYLLPSSVDR